MTLAEIRYKFTVVRLIHRGVYPAASAIRTEMLKSWPNMRWQNRNLNGRQVKWRNEIFSELTDPRDQLVLRQHERNVSRGMPNAVV